MNELTEADMIWNRACAEEPLRKLVGDRSLADLLYCHGLVMNGGVLHSVECMTEEELSDAQVGYRYFGIEEVASLLSLARELLDSGDDIGGHEGKLDREYTRMVPSDRTLSDRFEERFKANSWDFTPVHTKDVG